MQLKMAANNEKILKTQKLKNKLLFCYNKKEEYEKEVAAEYESTTKETDNAIEE